MGFVQSFHVRLNRSSMLDALSLFTWRVAVVKLFSRVPLWPSLQT